MSLGADLFVLFTFFVSAFTLSLPHLYRNASQLLFTILTVAQYCHQYQKHGCQHGGYVGLTGTLIYGAYIFGTP